MTSERVSRSVLEDASAFLDSKYSVDDVSAVLGMQLDAVEAVNRPTQFGVYMEAGVDLKKTIPDFAKRGLDFIKSIIDKLLEKVCPWWKNNKEKVGEKLVASLTAFIIGTKVIPEMYSAIAGIVAIVAVYLIKKGLDALCKNKQLAKL